MAPGRRGSGLEGASTTTGGPTTAGTSPTASLEVARASLEGKPIRLVTFARTLASPGGGRRKLVGARHQRSVGDENVMAERRFCQAGPRAMQEEMAVQSLEQEPEDPPLVASS